MQPDHTSGSASSPASASEEAWRLYNLGRHAPAMQIGSELLRRNPRNADAAHLLGLIHWAEGRRDQALGMLQGAATLAPDHPVICSNFGGILLSVGHFADAGKYLAHAIRLRPGFADAHCNMGNLLRVQGDPTGAEAAYRRALAIEPRMAPGHNNLGLIFYMAGRKEQAVASYRAAIAIDPTFPEAFNNLGNALGDLEQDDEAIQCLEEALRLRPKFAEAHSNLAKLLLRKERLAPARAHLMQALNLQPDFAGAYHNLGTLYRTEGAFPEAEGCFRKSVALDSTQYMSYAGITGTRKMKSADRPLIDRLEQILREAGNRNTDEISHLHFALGKAYDDLGEHAPAFAHYRIANDLEHERLPQKFEPALFKAHIDKLISRFTPEFFARYRNAGSSSDLPILIVGMMRSGTSLVEQILSSHPKIHGAGELIYWANEDRRLRTDLQDPSAETIAEVGNQYLALLRGLSTTALRVTDKMPHNFLHLGLIRLAFPNARIIHCRRNPIDTCLSIYFQNFPALHPYAYNLDDLAAFYQQYHRLMQHWRQLLPPASMLELQYEDLIADQEAGSRRMIEFCGLEWDERCLMFQDNQRVVRTASSWQVRQPMYRTSVARWQKYQAFIGPLARLPELAP